nr:glycosyltransferase family 4 protein [uncultured Romboutsia sp.]
MKVFILTPYIFIENEKNFQKNKTGFALIMNDIAESLVKNNIDTYVLTQSSITKGKYYEGLNIVKRTWIDILLSIKLKYINLAIKLSLKNGLNIRNISRAIFYSISGGYVEKCLREIKPDVIHIHSLSTGVIPFIKASLESNIPFIITVHGIIPDKSSSSATDLEKNIEKNFYKISNDNNIDVTVISTGMKERISKKYDLEKNDNINVILNGTKISKNIEFEKIDLRLKYNIPINNKILLCVGSICERKNQIQLIRSIALLEDNVKHNITLLLLGNDNTNGLIESEINRLQLNEIVKVCGFIDKKIINQYYNQADFNLIVSTDEGFGLSIIEGFLFGLPTLTFSDLDAVKDLYDDKCMITINDRRDESLANAIELLCSKNWDKEYIIEYSNRFSTDSMAKKYIDLYNIVKLKNTKINQDIIDKIIQCN